MNRSTIKLTKEQIDFFWKEGYLAIDELTNQSDIDFLRYSYDRIFSEKAGRDLGDQFDLAGTDDDKTTATLPQILNPARYAPEMNDSQLLTNTIAVAKQLLGENAVCEFAHAIYKPPKIGSAAPWHQDAAYWEPHLRFNSISIWVPLQEATEENGCMQFVPGSQNLDIITHQSINNDPKVHGLELAPQVMDKTKNKVVCPLPPGGATFHGPYMLHKTGPNISDIPRRALILNAMLSPEKRKDPLKFPWLEEKETARAKRVKAAKEAGMDVWNAPTGKK